MKKMQKTIPFIQNPDEFYCLPWEAESHNQPKPPELSVPCSKECAIFHSLIPYLYTLARIFLQTCNLLKSAAHPLSGMILMTSKEGFIDDWTEVQGHWPESFGKSDADPSTILYSSYPASLLTNIIQLQSTTFNGQT